MQIAFSDGSHIVDNPAQYAAAHRRLRGVGATGPLDAGSIAAVAAQGAATAGGILAGLSAMGALAPEFALAGPIGAAVAGLVSIGLLIASEFSGYGLNCEEETAYAFNLAGGVADIIHINDLIDRPNLLKKYQILAIPGGFSYGDDLGSGKAYANKLNNHLKKQLLDFATKDKLIIGICNGFQVLTNLGLLPGVLTFNDNNRYTDRWVDVRVISSPSVVQARGLRNKAGRGPALHRQTSPWLTGISHLSLPIAHGEGKFMAYEQTFKTIKSQKMIGAVYYKGEMCDYQNLVPNPNGSTLNIAMLTSANGKILGTMPHPERAMFFTQLPNWPQIKEKLIRAGKPLPKFGPGLQIFKNSINYFK